MIRSAFSNRSTNRQAIGGGSPTMTFNAMLVRDEHPATGLPVLKWRTQTARGLLVWDGATYEGLVPVVKGRPLAREGTYTLDATASADPVAGSGFRIPMRLKLPSVDWGPFPPAPNTLHNPILQAALDMATGITVLALHGPVEGEPMQGLGLLGADAAAFRQRWQATARNLRPARLLLTHAMASGPNGR
jgi:hypothetical protein